MKSRLNEYFNIDCFTPATVDFGDTGCNILRGPNQKDVDISIIKHFPITERMNFEFRTEFFNPFNQVSFANRTQPLRPAEAEFCAGISRVNFISGANHYPREASGTGIITSYLSLR